jgi:uncharacterized protein
MKFNRNMQVVVKVSKFCNLRCRYCYEMPELGNPEAMSRAEVAAMYRSLRDHVRDLDARDGRTTRLDFIWHGGEPLMQPAEFYRQTMADQLEIFGDRTPRNNSVQTNLVLLDEERLRLLTDGTFDSVGVSLDVKGGLRVNVAGRDQQQRVIANLKRLAAVTRRLGCISVLTARISAVDEIFGFFEGLGFQFRVLPLFDTGERSQTSPLEVTLEQELSALAQLMEMWLSSDTMRRPPSPLNVYLQIAARYLSGTAGPRYRDRREWLPLVLVNTDGSCFTYGEPYGEPEWSIGNVFTQSFGDMLAGETFERCAVEAERRVARNCLGCPFFDACGGSLAAETETRERDEDGHGTLLCTARPVIAYIAERLRECAPELVGEWRDMELEPAPSP